MLTMKWGGGTSSVYIWRGGSLILSFSLRKGRGDYESGGGAATRNPFTAENIPEVACQDQSISPHPSSHCFMFP